MPPKSTTLVDLRNDLCSCLAEEIQLPAETAQSVVWVVTDFLRRTWGGINLYIPKDDDLQARDNAMWAAFDGTNYDEIGQKFGMSGRHARNRINAIRDERNKRQQPGLFGE